MKVTAWNNGSHLLTGAGYGLKVDINDRDKYFRKSWTNVFLELEGEEERILVNVDKSSFWSATCGELISKDIGVWLIKNKKAPWPNGYPVKMRMDCIDDNRFNIEFM